MDKITEQSSNYHNLENMSIRELLENINKEDQTVPKAVAGVIPVIEKLVGIIVQKMQNGGRLFYVGAGTSGRLGILDASECPPTFGVPGDWVIGIIAGGEPAIRSAVENAEDDIAQAWQDLQKYFINDQDVVIGIAASGSTPYVVQALGDCREHGIFTACITCNYNTPLAANADLPIEIIVGSEFVTGSSRMKAGTAQKLMLNMISTSVMIRLGRVKDNKMVDMQLSNQKLLERGTRIIMNSLKISYEEAHKLLREHGSVRKAIEHFQ
jgi:N-acetylmuramic acid 6-phosphate etherase